MLHVYSVEDYKQAKTNNFISNSFVYVTDPKRRSKTKVQLRLRLDQMKARVSEKIFFHQSVVTSLHCSHTHTVRK